MDIKKTARKGGFIGELEIMVYWVSSIEFFYYLDAFR